MRLALDPRARRLLRLMPRTNAFALVELLLLSLLAIQCARLVWTIVTPVGPVGDWKAESELRPAAPAGLLGGFDPFFRLGGGNGPVVVTALDLALYGIRQDRASGRGSAIIAGPDGVQRSFAVGEEIVPGPPRTARHRQACAPLQKLEGSPEARLRGRAASKYCKACGKAVGPPAKLGGES